MADQPQRTLVEKWYVGLLPRKWEEAQALLASKLKGLERVLGVLHQAVEYPPPSAELTIPCSASTAITTTSLTDITGCTYTFTPDVDMRVLVGASFVADCTLFGAAARRLICAVAVNGTAETPMALQSPIALSATVTASAQWVIALSAGTAYTLKLQARTNNVDTTYSVLITHTRMTVVKIPNTWRPGA
jgi:hypothetical protein